MNIIYASNDGYARHLGVSLYSLLEHHQQMKEITVYLLSVGMSEENQKRLGGIADKFGRELIPVEMGDLRRRFPETADTRGFDISAMTRLFAASELPAGVRKAIYLDCDTVILGSLEPLWEMSMGDCLVGMVPEPTAYEAMRAAIGLTMADPYYNSGVLLMDLEGWRRERIEAQLLDFYLQKGGNLFACDQDTLNGVLRGRILTVPPCYNFFTNYHYFRYRTLTGISASYRAVTPRQFARAQRHPVVVHYMGDERPWIAGNRNYYRKHYEHYLERTPWWGESQETGKELYMLLYWGMNQLTLISPGLRAWISRLFGMKVIDSRKQRKEPERAAD